MAKRMNHGDFREFVTAGMYEMLEKVIEAKSGRREPYYIIVLVRPRYQGPPAMSRIENGLAVRNPTRAMNIKGCIAHARIFIVEPPDIRKYSPQLGTICWRIDNRKGQVKLCWALPFDKPNLTEDSDNAGDVAKAAAQSAQDMGVPLFYN